MFGVALNVPVPHRQSRLLVSNRSSGNRFSTSACQVEYIVIGFAFDYGRVVVKNFYPSARELALENYLVAQMLA